MPAEKGHVAGVGVQDPVQQQQNVVDEEPYGVELADAVGNVATNVVGGVAKGGMAGGFVVGGVSEGAVAQGHAQTVRAIYVI